MSIGIIGTGCRGQHLMNEIHGRANEHNVEITGHRVSWYHKEHREDDKIFYTLTMGFDPQAGHIHYIQASTEDKKGDARFTTDFIHRELRDAGLITAKQDRYIRRRMGFPAKGGD